MIKIFYENIFISDIVTNKSMSIDEMLELIDFDEQAFRDKHGFEALDPAHFRTIYFDFEQSLPHIGPETEELIDVDRSVIKYIFKRLNITEHLTLILYDSGQATLEYRNNEIETFWWDDEAAEMIAEIDNVKISDLFSMMYSKRWQSII